MGYSTVASHHNMVHDQRRNKYYQDALRQVITPNSIVLDLGTGLGVHGILAAKLGAKKVYMVEPEDLINIAKQVAIDSHVDDQLEFYKGRIENIELPDKVDVIISVLTGNLLLNEDLLSSLFYARDKYLNTDGVLIPAKATLYAAPIHLPELYKKEIAVWSHSQLDVDMSAVRTYAGNKIYYRQEDISKGKLMAESQVLKELDFLTASALDLDTECNYLITKSKLCHGWVGWFDLQLGDQWLSQAPGEPNTHWSSGFLPLDPPIIFYKDDIIKFRVMRPENGNWSWIVKQGDNKQVHSIILAEALSLETVNKSAFSYVPILSKDGEAMKYVLSIFNGEKSIQDVVDKFMLKFEADYSVQEAKKLILSLVRHYG